MNRPLMAGNWKMYKTPAETRAFFEAFIPLVRTARDLDIVICPPFVNLPAAVAAAETSRVAIGGQNLDWHKEGAFTGEVSGPMLKAVGANWVIVGHSERRQFFGETDETVYRRTVAALDAGLRPIVCVGELLEHRESGRTEEVLLAQFEGGIAPLMPEQFAQIAVAYEPVWAIGTGRTATPEIAADAHRVLRSAMRRKFNAGVRILYGGSVKPDNIKGLMAQSEIQGVLVGGASLAAESFAAIVNF
jgi:triosephosphate isomerase